MGVLDTLAKSLAVEESVKKGKSQSGKTKADKSKLTRKLALEIAELERKEGALLEREKQLNKKEKDLEEKLAKVEEVQKQEVSKLEKIAKLSFNDAKKLLLEATEKKLAEQLAKKIRANEEEVPGRGS